MIKMLQKVPIGYECKKCGKIHYPKHGRCLNCKNIHFKEVELPSEGILITWTKLKALPTGIDKKFLFFGIINLNEARYIGQIDVENQEDIQIGMKLKAKWSKIRVIDNKDIFGFVWAKS